MAGQELGAAGACKGHWGRGTGAGVRHGPAASAGRHWEVGAGRAGGRQQARAARACGRWACAGFARQAAAGARQAAAGARQAAVGARQGAAGHGNSRQARGLCARAGPVRCSCTRLGFQPGFFDSEFFLSH